MGWGWGYLFPLHSLGLLSMAWPLLQTCLAARPVPTAPDLFVLVWLGEQIDFLTSYPITL